MNWNDPVERAQLIERIGATKYNKRFQEHLKEITVATINGHAIWPIQTERFGRLFMVSGTGRAFSKLKQAKRFAETGFAEQAHRMKVEP